MFWGALAIGSIASAGLAVFGAGYGLGMLFGGEPDAAPSFTDEEAKAHYRKTFIETSPRWIRRWVEDIGDDQARADAIADLLSDPAVAPRTEEEWADLREQAENDRELAEKREAEKRGRFPAP